MLGPLVWQQRRRAVLMDQLRKGRQKVEKLRDRNRTAVEAATHVGGGAALGWGAAVATKATAVGVLGGVATGAAAVPVFVAAGGIAGLAVCGAKLARRLDRAQSASSDGEGSMHYVACFTCQTLILRSERASHQCPGPPSP
jgi:hypothetical protein